MVRGVVWASKLEGFFPRMEYGELAVKDVNNQWSNRAGGFVMTIYHCYQWRDPNTEKERLLKKQKVAQ